MSKIAVMGDKDSIYGFAALGLSVFECSAAADAAALLRRLAASDYAVIYITEKLAALIPEEIDRFRGVLSPAVILIPGVSGNTGKGLSDVEISVEKAVGSNILSN